MDNLPNREIKMADTGYTTVAVSVQFRQFTVRLSCLARVIVCTCFLFKFTTCFEIYIPARLSLIYLDAEHCQNSILLIRGI